MEASDGHPQSGRHDTCANDRFSNLPVEIIQHVMSFLLTIDATKTSILSKRFRSLWASLLVIDLDDSLFYQKVDNYQTKFLSFVDNTLQQRDPAASIRKFRVHANGAISWDEQFEGLIKFAINHNVKELVLDMAVLYAKSLPQILVSARWISTLELVGLTLRSSLDSVIIECPFLEILSLKECYGMKDLKITSSTLREIELSTLHDDFMTIEVVAINLRSFLCIGMFTAWEVNLESCKSLETLVIEGLNITNEFLRGHFTALCLLEYLELRLCTMSPSSKISSASLKTLDFNTCYGLREVEIEAPNLQSLVFDGNRMPRESIHIAAYKFLQDLTLERCTINNGWIEDLLSAHSGLKNLTLLRCKMLEKIQIFHQHLKSLALHYCKNLKEVEICTPNLVSLRYEADFEKQLMTSILLIYPNLVDVVIISGRKPTSMWLEYFMTFLGFFRHCKAFRFFCIYNKLEDLIFSEEEREKMVYPLCDLEHWKINCLSELLGNAKLVDSLLKLFPKANIQSSKGNKISIPEKYIEFQIQFDKRLGDKGGPWAKPTQLIG